MSGQIENISILERLADLLSKDVEERDINRARLHLLDWIGCAAGGVNSPVGNIMRESRKSGDINDAYYWGALGNVLEMDDVDKRALLHPGPSIIPAIMALANELDAKLEDVLIAIVRGYEATIRLGRAVGVEHYAIWHNTGTCGPIGAAAGCASLLNLDVAKTAHAMALAQSASAGLWQTRHEPQSMGKQLHTSNAARSGYDAAKLASRGYLGPLSILEGAQGFFKATCGDANPEDVLRDYDASWLINEVSFKPWPACRHAHAAIDAAMELKTKLSDDQLPSQITVRTYGDALKFCDKPSPQTVIEAKFSIQHAVAICLLKDKPELKDFELDALNLEDVKAMRSKVSVEISEPYNSAFPAQFGAEIEADGLTVVVSNALGDPENPVADKQLIDKAKTLLLWGGADETQASDLIENIVQGNSGQSIRDAVSKIEEVLS